MSLDKFTQVLAPLAPRMRNLRCGIGEPLLNKELPAMSRAREDGGGRRRQGVVDVHFL